MPTAPAAAPPDAGAAPTRRSRALLLGLTLAAPVLLLALIEVALRLAWPDATRPLFLPEPSTRGAYLVANPRVGARWFAGLDAPPAPASEPFAAAKPARALRLFVLGESTTAGFPYPRNARFSRLLRDALRDVLPDDSVEVVNLGIAATNSHAMLDLAGEVLAQQPDAVLIYAGHNEYYGALGVGSTVGGVATSPGLVRAVLRLQRLRTVAALGQLVAWARGAGGRRPSGELEAASLMEVLARDQQIALGGATFVRGVRQFESNLAELVAVFRRRGVPVFVGSLASNLGDQAPFAAAANDAAGGARATWNAARAALAAGDTAGARALFTRARDLDVVRFRAPSAFNAVLRRVADAGGATYVPVAEAFARESPGGIPGEALFLEHVHPTRRGYALIGRTFYEALADARFLGRSARPERLRPWAVYEAGMTLTTLDERVALHATRTLAARWPFVPVAAQRDYRGTYRPAGFVDSAAFAVSRGARWDLAKLGVGVEYQRRGHPDSAAAEYAGLVRDAPLFDEPLRRMAAAALQLGDTAAAVAGLGRAFALRPSAEVAEALGRLALRRRDLAGGIAALERAVQLEPMRVSALYELSLAYGMARNLDGARATARRVAALDPRHPGLAGWMQAIGLLR